MKYLKRLYYFFPVQLLAVHLTRHQYYLGIWIWFTLVIANIVGRGYGVPGLFLNPEYLGEVGYVSFAIVGVCFGAFLLTWNVTSYLLHSHSFPFMASLRWPFAMFFLNNSLVPVAFIIFYFIRIYIHQGDFEYRTDQQILFEILGFLAGMTTILILATIYFSSTNKNILSFIKTNPKTFRRIKKRIVMKREKEIEVMQSRENRLRVDYYITSRFNIRHTREVEHYEHDLLMQVFKQHHVNALIAQIFTLAILIGLGYMIEYPAFQIPASGSVFLFATLSIAMLGVFRFWTARWSLTVFIILMILLNLATKYNIFSHTNKAYGLDYETTPAEYSLENLRSLCTKEQIEKDIEHTKGILTVWRKNHFSDQPWWFKPKMVIINSSGGGARSGVFTMACLQKADSILGGELMKHTVFMTGASGGMFGISYFRELYLKKIQEKPDLNLYDPEYAREIGMDLLNPILFTVITNDIFYPWQTFKVDSYTYTKDRGYMMEQQLLRNTRGALNKRIRDYRVHEAEGTLPITVFSNTIVNDSRRFFISAQPVSYLMRPIGPYMDRIDHEIDGIDFGKFFKDQNADNLLLTSAIRMNSSYPFILPNVTLPSYPRIDVYDAGARDNFGLSASIRFIEAFSDWINRNTSGVILIQIRGDAKQEEIEPYERKAFLARLFAPIGNLAGVTNVQDYNLDFRLNTASEKLNGNLDVVRFQYIPSEEDQRAAMSLHLTGKEMQHLLKTANNEENQCAYEELRRLIDESKP